MAWSVVIGVGPPLDARSVDRLGEGGHDPFRHRREEFRLDVGNQRTTLPVVGHAPRLRAQRLEEQPNHARHVGADALHLIQRTGRQAGGVVQADDRRHVLGLEMREEADLEQAPVPVQRRGREQQHEQVTLGEVVLGLPVPVDAGAEILPGHPAIDPTSAERLELLHHELGQLLVGQLVADEDLEGLLLQPRHATLPAIEPETDLDTDPTLAPQRRPDYRVVRSLSARSRRRRRASTAAHRTRRVCRSTTSTAARKRARSTRPSRRGREPGPLG